MRRLVAFVVLTVSALVVVTVWFMSDGGDGGSKVDGPDDRGGRTPGPGGPSGRPLQVPIRDERMPAAAGRPERHLAGAGSGRR